MCAMNHDSWIYLTAFQWVSMGGWGWGGEAFYRIGEDSTWWDWVKGPVEGDAVEDQQQWVQYCPWTFLPVKSI